MIIDNMAAVAFELYDMIGELVKTNWLDRLITLLSAPDW